MLVPPVEVATVMAAVKSKKWRYDARDAPWRDVPMPAGGGQT